MSAIPDMIERVARFLCRVSFIDHECPDPEDIAPHVEEMWTAWIGEARDLLAAMREPTKQMTEAGIGMLTNEGSWRAMIDAALEDGR